MGEISDIISFFDLNNEYTVKDAKFQIAKARRAVFELAIYTTPEFTLRAISAVESVNTAASAQDPTALAQAMNLLQVSVKELTQSMYEVRGAYEDSYIKLLE